MKTWLLGQQAAKPVYPHWRALGALVALALLAATAGALLLPWERAPLEGPAAGLLPWGTALGLPRRGGRGLPPPQPSQQAQESWDRSPTCDLAGSISSSPFAKACTLLEDVCVDQVRGWGPAGARQCQTGRTDMLRWDVSTLPWRCMLHAAAASLRRRLSHACRHHPSALAPPHTPNRGGSSCTASSTGRTAMDRPWMCPSLSLMSVRRHTTWSTPEERQRTSTQVRFGGVAAAGSSRSGGGAPEPAGAPCGARARVGVCSGCRPARPAACRHAQHPLPPRDRARASQVPAAASVLLLHRAGGLLAPQPLQLCPQLAWWVQAAAARARLRGVRDQLADAACRGQAVHAN